MNIWSAISSKKFFQALLDLLRTKDIPEVQMKLLGLIQKWGLNFEDKKNVLPNFFSVYNKLRMNNVQFPSDYESNYQQYISENNKNNNYEKNSYNENDYNKDEASEKDEDEEVFYYMDSLKNVLKVPNFEHKYRRLVNFLVKMHENIQMANLLIDNREHGGLKDIISTLREGNNTLIDTIQGGRLKDEKLMEITLGTTEDINQTLGRDEDIKNGYKPNKFKSYFVINNVIRIKNNPNNNHRNRAKSTKPKKAVQRNNEKYGLDNYDKNKYKEKMGPKNVDDIFDLFSASNPSNEPQYFTNNNNINNNRGNNNNNLNNNINNFFNSSQTQQLRNNPMNNFFNNNNNNNNLNPNNNNRNNNNTMFFNPNMNNQQRPVMTNFDILEQKLNNLNNEQNQNNNYNMPPIMNNNQNQNMQFNQGFNNNNMNNRNNNNNLMNMLDQLGPGPQNNTNNNQLVPYIGSFNNQNNNNNNMNQNNNFMNNNNNNFNSFGNNNNQYNNNNRNNMYNSQVINRGNNINLNNNNNRMNMSQNLGNNNNWMNQNNNMNNNMNNNQQMNFEEMQKQQRLKELDDLF